MSTDLLHSLPGPSSKQTVATSWSPGVEGCTPLIHPAAHVPQWSGPGDCSGILVPAAPDILYHPAPFQSGLVSTSGIG